MREGIDWYWIGLDWVRDCCEGDDGGPLMSRGVDGK